MRNDASNGEKLLQAAQNGNLEDVQSSLNGGVDVNYKDDNGDTALHFAARGGHLTVVKELLNRGANVNLQDQYELTALHRAILSKNQDIVQILLNEGADVDLQDQRKETALHLAVMKGDRDVVEKLLKKEANTSLQDVDGKTPADLTTDSDIREIINNHERSKGLNQYLQNDGTDPDFHEDVMKEDIDFVGKGLEKKANKGLQDVGGKTPRQIMTPSGLKNGCSSATFLGYGAGVGLMATGVGLLVDDLATDSPSLDDNVNMIAAALMLVGLLLLAGTWVLSRPSPSSSIDDNASGATPSPKM